MNDYYATETLLKWLRVRGLSVDASFVVIEARVQTIVSDQWLSDAEKVKYVRGTLEAADLYRSELSAAVA